MLINSFLSIKKRKLFVICLLKLWALVSLVV